MSVPVLVHQTTGCYFLFSPPGVADSEPVCPQWTASNMQRQHPKGSGGDLGLLRRSLLRAGRTFSERRAAAFWEYCPVGSQERKRLQRLEERK